MTREPQFTGCFSDPREIDDENPWSSEHRLQYNRRILGSITKQLRTKALIKFPDLPPTPALVGLFVNLLSLDKKIRVLDFSGGTGVIYFLVYSLLFRKEHLSWHVVDSDKIIAIGQEFSEKEFQISFSSALPADEKFDVVLINSSLQYVWDYKATLEQIILLKPTYFVLTRLMAGEIEPYFTCQNNVHGGRTPAQFLNQRDVILFMAAKGFRLVFSAFAKEDSWNESAFKGIPKERQLKNSLNLFFRKEDDCG